VDILSVPDEGVATASGDGEVEISQEVMNTKCPYTGMEMVNPVRNKHCGHSYDREGILQYIKQRKHKARYSTMQLLSVKKWIY